MLGCEVCGVIVYVEDDDQLQGGNDPNKMENMNDCDSGVHHTLFLVRVPKST